MSLEFQPFPKVSRWSRPVTISEKIDGTNAQVVISIEQLDYMPDDTVIALRAAGDTVEVMRAGSRSRWVTPNADGKDNDNAGFAAWCVENRDELFKLGEGQHFGEWWGQSITRKYGLTEKRFSLYNTSRWSDELGARPACCHVVPVLFEGLLEQTTVDRVMSQLSQFGSVAAPGFMKPEGIMIYHHAANMIFKKTLLRDEVPKGQVDHEARLAARLASA